MTFLNGTQASVRFQTKIFGYLMQISISPLWNLQINYMQQQLCNPEEHFSTHTLPKPQPQQDLGQ